jgi:hypothetical protein
MQLVLERCRIRPWRLDDADSLAKHANNPASACAGKGWFRFRRTPNEQRHQGWRTSRFTALREDEVETRRRCVRAEWRQLYLAVWPYITPTSPWTSWSLSCWRRTELESDWAACFVSAQPESNDQDAMRATSKRMTILLCRFWRGQVKRFIGFPICRASVSDANLISSAFHRKRPTISCMIKDARESQEVGINDFIYRTCL